MSKTYEEIKQRILNNTDIDVDKREGSFLNNMAFIITLITTPRNAKSIIMSILVYMFLNISFRVCPKARYTSNFSVYELIYIIRPNDIT